MSDESNSNMQDTNSLDQISSELAAEIERGLANAQAAACRHTEESDARMLDAICDAIIAEAPGQHVSAPMTYETEPLASLLHTIQAEAHATVKPDTRQEDSELLQEIEKAAEECVTEFSLHDIAQNCAEERSQIVVESVSAVAPSESDATAPVALEATQSVSAATSAGEVSKSSGRPSGAERRRRRRALISAPVRVRGVDLTNGGPDEVSTTVDVSRLGLLFVTSLDCYSRDMDVMVTFPYSKAATTIQPEQHGRVVRVHEDSDGRRSVAIALGIGVGDDLVDSCGRKLGDACIATSAAKKVSAPSAAPEAQGPMVLAVDEDATLRDSLKAYLQSEGYQVIAAGSVAEAREILAVQTPALVIAEVEGDGLPGFDLCAHVKTNSRLRHIPVVLMTRSAYPSDYSTAHSVGAVVCMAKPFKQERLGHVVRLLAPLPLHLQPKFTPRPGDPSRRPGCDSNGRKKALRAVTRLSKRFRFPSFR